MFLRRITDFILQGRWQAIGIAFLLAFVPLLGSSLSLVIAAFVTLRVGVLEGALVTIAASLPFILQVYGIPANDQTQLVLVVFGIVLFSNFLTWLFAALLRRYNNWSITIEIAILLGIIIVGVLHLVHPDIIGWWQQELTAYFNNLTTTVTQMNKNVKTMSPEQQLEFIGVLKYYATGIVTTLILVITMLQVLLARWWQSAMFNPGGLRRELHQIRLSQITAILFLVFIVLAYFKNDLAIDTLPILYTGFFVAGLSLIHRVMALSKKGLMWLILIYLFLILLFPRSLMIIIMIAMIGFFDTWFDFRKRLN